MDRKAAIEWNSEALKRILAMIVAMLAGGARPASPGDMAEALPRHLYRAVLALLRPAESAARRLIIVAAHEPIGSTRLALRISAFGRALDDLPGQAAHLTRQRACRAAGGDRRLWPPRMGRPPGSRERRPDDVHQLLTDLHGFAPDTS